MKRMIVVIVAGALLSGTAVAPPAHARDVKECLDRNITLDTTTVRLEGLNVVIDPNGVPSDVDAVASFAAQVLDLATCIEGGLVTGHLGCVSALALEIVGSLDPSNGNLRYVTRDPETGVIVIHTDALIGDLTRCA